MGMYDEVMIPCPYCGKLTYEQSKGGDCLLIKYTYPSVPQKVLSGLVGEEIPCDHCDMKFSIKRNFYLFDIVGRGKKEK